MNNDPGNTNYSDIPASLRRGKKEPLTMVQVRLPLSWVEELRALAVEYDQDVSTFLREATEDWLRRARGVRKNQGAGNTTPPYPGVSE